LISFTGQLLFLTDPQSGELSGPLLTSLFIAYGLGAGLIVPSLLKISLQQVPAEIAGIASGVYTTVQQFSSALGISVIGGVFFYAMHKGGDSYALGYKAALECMILYTTVIIGLLFVLKRMDK
jgi:MFS family permease